MSEVVYIDEGAVVEVYAFWLPEEKDLKDGMEWVR